MERSADLELDEWRVAIDQATVRQMHLWNTRRRIDDLYFVVTEPVIRVRRIEWRGALVEERRLNAIPNYEPLIASDAPLVDADSVILASDSGEA